MISHVELLLLLYFLTTSGEIWSWRQAEKCDLHIHKKQPHKVGKFATCKFYLSLSLFSLFLKASFAITGSWESYSGCQMLSCAVWTSTKVDIRKRKWTSIVQVRVNVWGKDARYCYNRNCCFFCLFTQSAVSHGICSGKSRFCSPVRHTTPCSLWVYLQYSLRWDHWSHMVHVYNWLGSACITWHHNDVY